MLDKMKLFIIIIIFIELTLASTGWICSTNCIHGCEFRRNTRNWNQICAEANSFCSINSNFGSQQKVFLISDYI